MINIIVSKYFSTKRYFILLFIFFIKRVFFHSYNLFWFNRFVERTFLRVSAKATILPLVAFLPQDDDKTGETISLRLDRNNKNNWLCERNLGRTEHGISLPDVIKKDKYNKKKVI